MKGHWHMDQQVHKFNFQRSPLSSYPGPSQGPVISFKILYSFSQRGPLKLYYPNHKPDTALEKDSQTYKNLVLFEKLGKSLAHGNFHLQSTIVTLLRSWNKKSQNTHLSYETIDWTPTKKKAGKFFVQVKNWKYVKII